MVNTEVAIDKAQFKICRDVIYLVCWFILKLNSTSQIASRMLIFIEHLRSARYLLGHHANIYLDVIKYSKVLDHLFNNCTSANCIPL